MLKAMATASIMALARTGSRRPLILVTELLDSHKGHHKGHGEEWGGCRAGLAYGSVEDGSQPRALVVSPDPGRDFDVLEPRDLVCNVWLHAVSVLVQVLNPEPLNP